MASPTCTRILDLRTPELGRVLYFCCLPLGHEGDHQSDDTYWSVSGFAS